MKRRSKIPAGTAFFDFCTQGVRLGVAESEIDEAIAGHQLRNEALRRLFLERGVDLKEPRKIECHFWTLGEEAAVQLEAALVTRGFAPIRQNRIENPSDSYCWNLEVGITQTIDLTIRREFTDELVRLAVAHSGKYDGWGTSI
jgi:hypothetical protein